MREGPTEIKGFKRIVNLPRLGKIRLGIKVKSLRTSREYPKEVEYFVCPPEVQYHYGEKPKLLDIMFPSEDQAVVMPYCYKSYGSNQMLKCKGDGQVGVWYNPKTNQMEERKCPCPELEWREEEGVKKAPSCGIRGHLMVILPKVSLGGVYQIDTGSVVNIKRILNAMDYWKGIVGRCKCIPLTLERVAEKMKNPADGTMQTHYLLKVSSNISIDTLNKAITNNQAIMQIEYKIDTPIEEGKLDDTPIETVDDRETIEGEKKEEDLTDLGLGDRHKGKGSGGFNHPAKSPGLQEGVKCEGEGCGEYLSPLEAEYSRKNCGGKVLCQKCQFAMERDDQ